MSLLLRYVSRSLCTPVRNPTIRQYITAAISPQTILTSNEVTIDSKYRVLRSLNLNLPPKVVRIECNQLESNEPIEDRLRVASIQVPGQDRPSLIVGLFDGHGGGTTADLISRRLFNYVALTLQPEPSALRISNELLRSLVHDLYESPLPDLDAPYYYTNLAQSELNNLAEFAREIDPGADIYTWLRDSFKRCDLDLSLEIQRNLQHPHTASEITHFYQSAAVSGCCACVMIIHDNLGYIASSGDCRAVMGITMKSGTMVTKDPNSDTDDDFKTLDLNDEHNCDNISEIKRLTAAHPRTEQNTLIRHNRLLGQLMPSRAFGDFNYKWPIDTIRSCGLIKAFGANVIPSNYRTPPYLIVEPDIRRFDMNNCDDYESSPVKYLVMATDGLWERFESSRDVIKSLLFHQSHTSVVNPIEMNSDGIPVTPDGVSFLDRNSATHLLRTSLTAFPNQDLHIEPEDLARLHRTRLESLLSLPPGIVRNFRDDISLVVVKLSDDQF